MPATISSSPASRLPTRRCTTSSTGPSSAATRRKSAAAIRKRRPHPHVERLRNLSLLAGFPPIPRHLLDPAGPHKSRRQPVNVEKVPTSRIAAGYQDHVVNDEALAYMRAPALAGTVIDLLSEHPDRWFADRAAWNAHLDRLGISALKVHPDPVRIATEGA